MKCKSVLVSSRGDGIDPDGVLVLIEVLNKLIPALKIDTSLFKLESEIIKRRLEELMKLRFRQLKQYENIGIRTGVESMYR